jgi:hypothetical protein
VSLNIIICVGAAREDGWMGIGLSCRAENAFLAALVVLGLNALGWWEVRRTGGRGLSRGATRRIQVWIFAIGMSIMFMVPGTACLIDQDYKGMQEHFDGPYGQILGCLYWPAIAGAIAVPLLTLFVWWGTKD